MPLGSELPDDEELHELVDRLDEMLHDYNYIGPHNLAGVLLSRVVLLTEHDPQLGKDLLRYVWERLDGIQQNGPDNMFKDL